MKIIMHEYEQIMLKIHLRLLLNLFRISSLLKDMYKNCLLGSKGHNFINCNLDDNNIFFIFH